MSRPFLGFVLLLCSASTAIVGELPEAPAPRVIPIAEWVKQLGSKDAREHEAAAERLSTLTLDPPLELLALAKFNDLDIRERASKVAQTMRWNAAAKRLPRGEEFANQGRIDLLVAATAVWDLKPDDSRLWVPAVDLGRRLIAKADMGDERKPEFGPSSTRDYASYLKRITPHFIRLDERYVRENMFLRSELIQAGGVEISGGINNSLIVSRGSVKAETAIQHSVVFANGDVTAVTGLFSVVIVCDGDIKLTNRFSNKALIVARGDIAIGGASASVLLAGGKVSGAGNRNSRLTYNVIKENTTEMLGIKFFELSTLGLEVKVVEKNLALTAISSDKRFFTAGFLEAGVKEGDIFVDVNGKKPDSAESLRRLLRDALAIGDATVNLKRGDKTMKVKVTLPE